jgi:glycosyltransferase involved in cell wall biosynthesis
MKSKMIRVGFLTGQHYPRLGGMEFSNHFLAETLNSLPDTQTSVACSTLPEIPKIFPYPYAIYRAKSFWRLTPWLHKLNRIKMIQKEKIDIIHGPMIHGGGVMAIEMKKQFGIPVVIQSHGSDVQVVPEIGYGACLNVETRDIVKNVIKRADHIIALSNLNKNQIMELGGFDDKISVIHNGIQYFEILKVPFIDIKEKYNLKSDDFVLICVGRNRPIKRMDLLFRALSIIKTKTSKVKCLCIGPKENLGKLVDEYKLQNIVRLTGKIPKTIEEQENTPYPELINCYRASNLYLSTSYAECFSVAAADALACGIPVLVGKNHGVRDIIHEGETGWVMKEETPEELAQIILEIKNKKNDLLSKKKDISESVQHLTWENTAIKMRNVYRELLEKRNL